MYIKKFAHGQTMKKIVTDAGALLCVESDTEGLSTTFAFADVKNSLAEIVPYVAYSSKSEEESVLECDNTSVVLASNGDLYMYIVGDVEQ